MLGHNDVCLNKLLILSYIIINRINVAINIRITVNNSFILDLGNALQS